MNKPVNFSLFLTAPFAAAALAGILTGFPAMAQPPPVERVAAPDDTFALVDAVSFGDTASEAAHQLQATRSETITGGLNEPARVLLPSPSTDPQENWAGGTLAFVVRVDGQKRNYITVRLWGSNVTANRLTLYCDGKQVGWRHLGEVDPLDFGSEEKTSNDRFFMNTLPLPLVLTQGKTSVRLEIRSSGPLWGYGTNFAQYQKPQTTPSRGIYRLTCHTGGFFVPPANEKQGTASPQNPPVRSTAGRDVMDALKARVNGEINGQLASPKPPNQMQMQFLARAYSVKWTTAYQNGQTVAHVVKGLDAFLEAVRLNPTLAHSDPVTPNAEWFGAGPTGDVVRLLSGPLAPFLDAPVQNYGGPSVTRRVALTDLLVESRDWHRRHRRMYTNQTMIIDLYIYLANRGVGVLSPAKALPEPEIRRYLYEAVGLLPWTGSDPSPTGDRTDWAIGPHYMQLTAHGLTRELGYVGTYGEVLDWVNEIYDATRPTPYAPTGDEQIKSQLIKIARARSYFRYPAVDEGGFRAMRMETIIGWRDAHSPGDVTYGQRQTRDGSALQTAANTGDAGAIGAAQQMIADHQFWASVQKQMEEKGLRVTNGLLDTPDQVALIAALPPSKTRLPMTPNQPDFVFSDEDDGVVAIKRGSEMLYVSLYWRARNGINHLARVHHLTPTFSRVATVDEAAAFTPSGLFYVRPDTTNFGFSNGGLKYPGENHSAHAGEILPIAKLPDGLPFKPGDESVYAGKADFYALRYGPYLIGMNCDAQKSYSLAVPPGVAFAPNLVTGKTVAFAGSQLTVAPRSTVVLYLGAEK